MSIRISPFHHSTIQQLGPKEYTVKCTQDSKDPCGIQWWLTRPEKMNQSVHYDPLEFHWIEFSCSLTYPHEGDIQMSYQDGLYQKTFYENPLHLEKRTFQQDTISLSCKLGMAPHIRQVGWRIYIPTSHSQYTFTLTDVKIRMTTLPPNKPNNPFPPAPYLMATHIQTPFDTHSYVFSKMDHGSWLQHEWNRQTIEDSIVIQVPYSNPKIAESIPTIESNEPMKSVRPRKKTMDPLYPFVDKISYMFTYSNFPSSTFYPQQTRIPSWIQHSHEQLDFFLLPIQSLTVQQPFDQVKHILTNYIPLLQPVLPISLVESTILEDTIYSYQTQVEQMIMTKGSFVPIFCFVLPPNEIVSIRSFERWLISILHLEIPTYHIHIWIPIDTYTTTLQQPTIEGQEWLELFQRIQAIPNSLLTFCTYVSTDIPEDEQEHWESYLSFQDLYRTMYDQSSISYTHYVWIHIPFGTYIPNKWMQWYDYRLKHHMIQIPLMIGNVSEKQLEWSNESYFGIPNTLFARCRTLIEKLHVQNMEHLWKSECMTILKKMYPSFHIQPSQLSYQHILWSLQ
jgi:hypothetical protein